MRAKKSVELPFPRTTTPLAHHDKTLNHETLRIGFAAHPLYGTSIDTMLFAARSRSSRTSPSPLVPAL